MRPENQPDELLDRVRRELARSRPVATRVVLLAGDPRTPVRRFAFAARHLAAGGAVGLVLLAGIGVAATVGHDRHAAVVSAPVAAPPPPPPALTCPPAPPPPAASSTPAPVEKPKVHPPPEHFRVEVINTGRSVDVVLAGPASEPDEASYRALRHELRSLEGPESPLDPRLIELLHQIAKHAGGTVQVVSAFRTPKTLHDKNYHTRGMAADVRVAGMTTSQLRDLARSLGAPGVGYYPTSHFVHVDMRDEPFQWTDVLGPGQEPNEVEPPDHSLASAAQAMAAASAEPLKLTAALQVDGGFGASLTAPGRTTSTPPGSTCRSRRRRPRRSTACRPCTWRRSGRRTRRCNPSRSPGCSSTRR